jgi:nitrogen fixation protein
MHSNNYIPADFSSAWAGAVLPLSEGWRLDEEMFLKRADG